MKKLLTILVSIIFFQSQAFSNVLGFSPNEDSHILISGHAKDNIDIEIFDNPLPSQGEGRVMGCLSSGNIFMRLSCLHSAVF